MTRRPKPGLARKEPPDDTSQGATNGSESPTTLVDLSTLVGLLKVAQVQVPALKYALGVVGLAAAGGIVGLIVGYQRTSIILFVLMFVGMVILFLFSILVRNGSSYSAILAANVFLWTIVAVFCLSLVFGFSAMVLHKPKGLYEFLNPRAQQAEQAQRVDTVVRTIVQLCLGTSSIMYHFDPQSGQLSGDSFVVEQHDSRRIADTVSTKIVDLALSQDERTRECMNQFLLALACVTVDERLISVRENEKVKDIPVTYYSKIADGSLVTSALARRGIKFTMATPLISDKFQTNTIRCSPASPGDAIKEVAFAILENGGSLHVIERTPRSDTTNDIFILARATFGGNSLMRNPLSRAQINALSDCPRDRLSNLPTYEPPRPTGRPDDMRFVSFFVDKDWNVDGQLTAAKFCKLRGHTDAVLYRETYTESQDDVVVYLGDRATCNGPRCRYFTKIICY
jgi:hypothetical protein